MHIVVVSIKGEQKQRKFQFALLEIKYIAGFFFLLGNGVAERVMS